MFNTELANSLGIHIVKKGHRGVAIDPSVDVAIRNQKDRYTISFSSSIAHKIGEYISVAATETRIYIIPTYRNDPNGYKLSGGKHVVRPCISLAKKVVNLHDFVGDHRLKFWDDLGAYFVSIPCKQEVVA